MLTLSAYEGAASVVFVILFVIHHLRNVVSFHQGTNPILLYASFFFSIYYFNYTDKLLELA